MKIISICDHRDICTGLQLAGIDGDVVHTSEAFSLAFKNALADRQVGILVITKNLAHRYAKQVNEAQLNKTIPLVVEL